MNTYAFKQSLFGLKIRNLEELKSMKKTRLFSLLMAVLIVMTAVFLSGCGEDEEAVSQNNSTREITALNMYILTEDTTTEAAMDKVEMALNRILLPNHKTMVNMNYFTAEEYWDVIDAALEETGSANGASITTEAVVKGTEGKSFTDMIEYIFSDDTMKIDLDKPQIDILVINDYDKYVDYANEGKLAGLNSLLTYNSKILNKTIHPTYMSAAKVGTETYGIPTNAKMEAGGYTYLVFNEDLLKKYGYEVKDLRNFAGVPFGEYLGKIKAGEPGVWPINVPLEMSGAEYYEDAFVTVSSQFNYIASDTRPIFMYKGYLDNRAARENYKKLGYFPAYDMGDAAKYAIKVEQSKELLTADEDKRWTDESGTTYVRYLYDIPRVEIGDVFNSVMCVSNTSPVPERAMELITLFQTNEELANLLQYGIEGEHYQVNQLDGSIAILSDEYAMDNIVTGNTFIKHLHPDNPDKNYVANAIENNKNIAPSAFLGFNLNLSDSDMSKYELVKSANAAAAKLVEDGVMSFEQARAIMRRENLYFGYDTDSQGNVAGIFGTVQQAQAQLSDPMEAGFGLGKEVLQYNEQFGIYLEKRPVEVAVADDAQAAEGDAVEGESAEGEEAVGEAADGEEAEAEAAAEENVEAENTTEE